MFFLDQTEKEECLKCMCTIFSTLMTSEGEKGGKYFLHFKLSIKYPLNTYLLFLIWDRYVLQEQRSKRWLKSTVSSQLPNISFTQNIRSSIISIVIILWFCKSLNFINNIVNGTIINSIVLVKTSLRLGYDKKITANLDF